MSRINLNKNVFNKVDFLKTINTSFTQLVPPTPVEVPAMNVDEFFGEYTRLFYDIPEYGETNTHEYLIKTSSEYIGWNNINAEIQALLDEIAQLRQELLDLNQEKLDLQLELATKETQNLGTIKNTKATLASTREAQTKFTTLT
jgi:ribosomal protein L29